MHFARGRNAFQMQSDRPDWPSNVSGRDVKENAACMHNYDRLPLECSKNIVGIKRNRLVNTHRVMPPRKKVAYKVKNYTAGRGFGWGRGSTEEPAGVVEDVPPPPYSQKGILTAQSTSDSDDDLHPSEAATCKSQKKRKRELVTADFTEEQEREMVEWLQAPQQNCLFNKKHPNYIRKGVRDALWEQKARELCKTSYQLKKWYTNMRSRFGKLKQNHTGTGEEELMTARDRWILHHFQFLRPYLIVQVKKRVKAKVRATTVPAPTQSESDHHPPAAAAQSDADTSLGSRATDDTDTTWGNIAELQKQLLNKLSETKKSAMQRQKDSFADYMKEVTYTFPPPMWLRFQSEVNSLMQEYQLELHQEHPSTHAQQQDEFTSPYPPELTPGPTRQQSPSAGWRQHPTQVHRPTSVWGTHQGASLEQEQLPDRPQSAPPPTHSASKPHTQPSTSGQGKDAETQHYTVYKSTIIKEENDH
ncbi:PREDICTED: uncharacterized protein LOC109488206 [Branchiostoma belcheri]|uniref:Uncharacterized protein LOC109488206 n=1 Tax=Branchiostoma belcheri TaxID=7741 RepID=A0A6P5A3X3_BRABE|nr:PREDICTED: uncharacterized protein LOC109488206 [Branchiostoma belcheri]